MAEHEKTDGGDGGGGGGRGKNDALPLPIPRNMDIPDGLQLKRSNNDNTKLGVWCTKAITEGSTFGPFQGEKVTKTRKDSDPLHVWEIVDLETKEFLFYVDATRTEYSNWMRYTQCARFYEEQNLIAEQEGIDIMYKAVKPIGEGEELLTWYKVPSAKRGQRQAGRMSGGKAKCKAELEMSAVDSVPSKPPVTASPSGKKKAVSPSKSKPVEDKAKTDPKKDVDTKQNKAATECVLKKSKQTDVQVAKGAEGKVAETKSSKTKQVKTKQGEGSNAKATQGEGKQGESQVISEVKTTKVKSEVKAAKVKSTEVKSETKAAKVKPTDVKSETKSKVKLTEVKSEAKAAKVKSTEVKSEAKSKVKSTEVKSEAKPKVKATEVKPEIKSKVKAGLKATKVKSTDNNKPEEKAVKNKSPERKVPVAVEVENDKTGPAMTEDNISKDEPAKVTVVKPVDKKSSTDQVLEGHNENTSTLSTGDVKVTEPVEGSHKKTALGKADGLTEKTRETMPVPIETGKVEQPVKFQLKATFPRDDDLVGDLDDEHDGDELEIDLGEESNDLEDEDLGDESDDSKMDCAKSSALLDPEKYQFELKKHHITKSRFGRKVFKCDICSGVYRHAFSLKRHYIRNHINLKFVSRADILNCQINPDVHDQALAEESEGGREGGQEEEERGEGEGCDRAISELTLPVPARNTESASEDVLDTNTEISDSKSVSVCSDNSTEDEATQSLSKQLLLKVESGVTGEGEEGEEESSAGLYRCNVCSKLFDNANSLKTHLEDHPHLPSSKAFSCDKCDMKFSHKQNLMRHLAVHTGEKPFVCRFCGKKFPTATNQKRHERIHLGRRISCDYCSSTFTQSGDLKKHVRKLHPECFHECAFCGKYFMDEEELCEHVASHNESLRSNEEESNRRRDAFRVDMEIDRMESMRLAEQKTPGFKFACTVCKKRFHDYANMCRHRRLAHQRHLLMGHGSTSSSPVPSPTKVPSEHAETQAFFYANIASKISENLNHYIEGTKDDIAKANSKTKQDYPIMSENGERNNPTIKQEKKDLVNYNFPGDFSPKENYRKVVENEDEVAQILATDLKVIQQKELSSKEAESGRATKEKDTVCLSEIKMKNTEKIGDSVSDLMAAELKVIQTLTDLKKMDEVNKAQAALKAVDLKVSEKVISQKGNREEVDSKPLIAGMNGVSLNIPVFNVSSLNNKKEVKTQPVCTVQPIQRQNPASTEPKQHTNLPSTTKCSPLASDKVPSNVMSPKPAFHEKSGSVKTSPGGKTQSSVKTSPSVKTIPPPIKTSSTFSLKIPQVRVCPVCRRLFNNDLLYHQHMMEKHKTSPEENPAGQSLRESREEERGIGGGDSGPAMDLSSKSPQPSAKPAIDHDEGARLLLDFALGVQEEVSRIKPALSNAASAAETSTPLDLSSASSSPRPQKASVIGERHGVGLAPHSHGLLGGRLQAPAAHASHSPPIAHSGSHAHPQAAHSSTRIPAAHSGNHGNNKQAKLHGVLSIPNIPLSTDGDLPAPLVTPPNMPKSPWQPQFPSSFLPKTHVVKKYICTVCYSEFRSRSLLFSHQRASHPNVRCDHVEVDSDVVAPWWQKPSPVGMLNVCSSQVADLTPVQQKHLICTKCSRKFTTTSDLHSHILECADKMKKRPKLLNKPQPHHLHLKQPVLSLPTATSTPTTTTTTITNPIKPQALTAICDVSMVTISKTEDTPASATSTKPERQDPLQEQQLQQMLSEPNLLGVAGRESHPKMAKMMANSMLKRIKKRKTEAEETGVVNKKKRRNPELLYNPQNHVRRREMTEVLDMQCCQGCGQHFSTISLLERHIPVCAEKDKLRTLQASRMPIDSLSEVSELRNMCRYCHKQFTYTGMLRKHVFEICPVRRGRLLDGEAVEEEWEHEIGQYQSSSASLDTCSNDGSHLDDAASIAASTSSHDTDSSKNRRKKRKNRGWGNSKKKRSLSEGPDVMPELNDEGWNPDDEVTGSEAAGNEDEEEEDYEGGLSDDNAETAGHKSEMETKEMLSALVATSSKITPQTGNLPTTPPNTSRPTFVCLTPKAEAQMNIKLNQDQQGGQNKGLTTGVASSKSPDTANKPQSKPNKVTEVKKGKTKAENSGGGGGLPFVLSVPQYMERVPHVKTKPGKGLHGDKQGVVAEARKKKNGAQKDSSKKVKGNQESVSQKSHISKLSPGALKQSDQQHPLPLPVEVKGQISHSVLPELGMSRLLEAIIVKEKQEEAGRSKAGSDLYKPEIRAVTDAVTVSKSLTVANPVIVPVSLSDSVTLTPAVNVSSSVTPSVTLTDSIACRDVEDMQPSQDSLNDTPNVSLAASNKDTKPVVSAGLDKEIQRTSEDEPILSKPLSEVTKGTSSNDTVSDAGMRNACVGELKQDKINENKPVVDPIPETTPVALVTSQNEHSSEAAKVEEVKELKDEKVSSLETELSSTATPPQDVRSERKKDEESDESSDEEEINEYINTFLAARRNNVTVNKTSKSKSVTGGSPKQPVATASVPKPQVKTESPQKQQTTMENPQKQQPNKEKPVLATVTTPKSSPAKNASKKEGTSKKSTTSPKKGKSGEKQTEGVKGKVTKKATPAVKGLKTSGDIKGNTESLVAVSPPKKKQTKAKASTQCETDKDGPVAAIEKTAQIEVSDQTPAASSSTSTPAVTTETKENKTGTKQTRPKKKSVEGTNNKTSHKPKSAMKDEKNNPAVSAGAEKKDPATPKAKKIKTTGESDKPGEKPSPALSEEGCSPKKEKLGKNISAGKGQKNESQKKATATKTEGKDESAGNTPDTAANRNRKRKPDPNTEGKAKGGSRILSPPPSKLARTRSLVNKTKAKVKTDGKPKPVQRRGTRSMPNTTPQQNKSDTGGQKAKSLKPGKKVPGNKIKRSVSMITRQVSGEKGNKTRGKAVTKPMRTRQTRHSL